MAGPLTAMSKPIAPILLIRLKARLPGGAVVGESRRVCHLVPVPESGAVPAALRTYCGQEITPGSAELLDAIAGMPCEACLAKSQIPVFAMLRKLPIGPDDVLRELDRGERLQLRGWSDRSLSPEQRLAARFVLLLSLQDPDRSLTIAEIADRMGLDQSMVNLIVLLYVSIGWMHRSGTPDQIDQPWKDHPCRLTERGTTEARRLLARDLTPTFADLAGRLSLDITVITDHE